MENLNIKGSHDDFFIPAINFNVKTGICEIAGESYLEETLKFYTPVYQWLERYTKEVAKPLVLNIKLTYFNTSSSRAILDMLNILKKYSDSGNKAVVNWFYDVEDIDLEEIEDFEKESGMKINIVPKEKL